MEYGNEQQNNPEETKICSKCKLPKLKSSFGKRSNTIDGLRKDCKDCRKLYYTSDHALALGRITDKKRSGSEKRRTSNNKAKFKYRRTFKAKTVNQRYFHNKRDAEYGALNDLSTEDIRQIYIRFNNKCFNCESIHKLEIDHHYPITKGVGLSIENAVLLCRKCNASKRDKLPSEFYTEKQLLSLNSILGI